MPYTWSTTPDNVKTVVDVLATEVLDAYIATAETVVAAECLASGYPDATLELIHRWLSAHYYACNKRRSAAEAVSGGASQTLDPVAIDLRLNSTHYGQAAMTVDTAGNLAAYNNSLGTVKKLLPIQSLQIVHLGHRHHHHRYCP